MNRYDHLGRRVQKIAPDGTHTFLYDGWRPVVEMVARPGGGTDRIEYHWGKDLSGSLDGAAGVGGLLYVKRNGAIYVPFGDAFGNVMGYWDENGAVVAEYAYDAFGRTVAKRGTMADVFSIRYSTKYYDAETGMYYYGKRYYLTALCRWLTRDPIEEQGGVNLYGFVGNSATRKWDSIGLKGESQWTDVGSSHELHVWNCDEWTHLTAGKAGGTQAKYVEHFKTVTFKSVLVVPEDYILYFSYGIVSTLGMSADPLSYWCLDISPLTLQKKCDKGKYVYRVKMAVKRLDKHPQLAETPEQHMKEKEGRVFYYGPK